MIAFLTHAVHLLFTENTVAAAIISGAFNFYLSKRVRKAEDCINGVAAVAVTKTPAGELVVGTERARARNQPKTNCP